jgi:putative CocE/NonD family hydrolase
MIKRAPNDPAWHKGGLWHYNMKMNVPGFWFMSWYDVSVGPNLAAYNHVRKTARPEIANQQYAVIAPTLHCGYKRATENTIVGERSMGDARLNYDELTYAWFDYFLKGEQNGILEKMPKVRYYTMGINKWQTSDTWPPQGAQPMRFFLSSGGKANTLDGDGVLGDAPPAADSADKFDYDPMNPVPSYGGNVCRKRGAGRALISARWKQDPTFGLQQRAANRMEVAVRSGDPHVSSDARTLILRS